MDHHAFVAFLFQKYGAVTLLVLIVRLVWDLLDNDRVELIYVCSLQHNVNQSEINKCNGGGDEENEIQDPSIYYRVTMTSAWGFSQNCAKKKKLLKICNFHYIFVNMHACVFGELQLKGSSDAKFTLQVVWT